MESSNDTCKPHELGKWYKCKGCGKAFAVFAEGVPGKVPPGGVAHWKPKAGAPVPCSLFNQLGAYELTTLHIDAEPWPEGNATGLEEWLDS